MQGLTNNGEKMQERVDRILEEIKSQQEDTAFYSRNSNSNVSV